MMFQSSSMQMCLSSTKLSATITRRRNLTLIIPTTRQKRYFAVAKRQAEKSTFSRQKVSAKVDNVRIGSAIVKGNYVVSSGCNKTKTHPVQQLHNNRHMTHIPSPKIHAEVDALIYSRYDDLSGCEIFVYRENKDGTLSNCRPCKACQGALKAAGIQHIYYTTEKGYHYERIRR